MNKTININLGGMPFVIDDEAYYRLENYLNSLERHFTNSEGFEEIIGDIEARIAEIFHKKLNGRNIVQEADVIHTISVMGTPDDFGEMAEEMQRDANDEHWQMHTGKKLYRDPDDKVIGGVCSGLAAYFGMDTVWVRIGFALVFFTMGFGLILYLIMWAIVPEAVTAGDRLAMQGEKINVNNIAKNIESGISNLSDTLQGLGKEMRGKKKRRSTTTAGNARNANTERFSLLDEDEYGDRDRQRSSRIAALSTAFKGTFIFLVIIILIALFFAWLALIGASLGLGYATSFILPWQGIFSYALALPIFLIISIPLFSIAKRIIRSVRPRESYHTNTFKWIPGVLTFFAVVGMFAILSVAGRHFKNEETVKSELLSFASPADPLKVNLTNDQSKNLIFRTDLVSIGKKHLKINHLDLNVTKSPDDKWHLMSIVKARGLNAAEGEKAAKSIHLIYELEGNQLNIDNGYSINKNDKFRAQSLTYELQVPSGGKLEFDSKALRKVPCEAFPDHEIHNDLLGKLFEMGPEKMNEVAKNGDLGGE